MKYLFIAVAVLLILLCACSLTAPKLEMVIKQQATECPPAYSLIDGTCYFNCLPGDTDLGTQCQVNEIIGTDIIQNRPHSRPMNFPTNQCGKDQTLYREFCYDPCPTGFVQGSSPAICRKRCPSDAKSISDTSCARPKVLYDKKFISAK